MPDMQTPERSLSVAEAFGRLPLEMPERSAWPQLAERIAAAQPARPRPRWPVALAMAASLAVAALMPRLMSPPTVEPTTDPAVATAAPVTLESLMIESAQLENYLSAVANDQMVSASTAALGLEFEDRLRQLDVALSTPTLEPSTRLQLWQQRVNLLRDYAGVQGTSQWLAADGKTLDGALVATF